MTLALAPKDKVGKRLRQRRGKKAPPLGGSLRRGKPFTKTGGRDQVNLQRGKMPGMYGQSVKKAEPDDGPKRTVPKLTSEKRKRLEKVNL